MYELEMPLRHRTGAVTIHPEAETKHHGLGGLGTTDVHLSQFWGLDVHHQRTSWVESWEDLRLGCTLPTPFPVPSRWERGERAL